MALREQPVAQHGFSDLAERLLRKVTHQSGIRTVLDDGLAVACGEGALKPLMLQRPGRAPVKTDAFLRGYPVPAGTVLPCPATS